MEKNQKFCPFCNMGFKGKSEEEIKKKLMKHSKKFHMK
jgi:predicted small metal-binding protein